MEGSACSHAGVRPHQRAPPCPQGPPRRAPQPLAALGRAAQQAQPEEAACSRRDLLRASAAAAAVAVAGSAWAPRGARAILTAPKGCRLHQDKLDGYYFFVPDTWAPVSTSGNDVFYRNAYDVSENLFVNLSSPSSSAFGSVRDLGGPEAAARRTLGQYLEELMSTRIGVKREGEVVSASARTADDGKEYYDIQVKVRSLASRNQLAASPGERQSGLEQEWERQYVTVLGTANKRLYEFRLQAASDKFSQAEDSLLQIARSFRCKTVV